MYGVYRISKKWWHVEETANGHTAAESAKVKRDGKHVMFKKKKVAEKWAKENAREGEKLFVRKVSKPIECPDIWS